MTYWRFGSFVFVLDSGMLGQDGTGQTNEIYDLVFETVQNFAVLLCVKCSFVCRLSLASLADPSIVPDTLLHCAMLYLAP